MGSVNYRIVENRNELIVSSHFPLWWFLSLISSGRNTVCIVMNTLQREALENGNHLLSSLNLQNSCFTLCSSQVDERALRDIMEMGFNKEAARQALMDNNNNIEVALNSLLTGSSGCRPGPVPAESKKPLPRGS